MKKINVVIVDDDVNMRKSLELALKAHKEFNLSIFKNAKDALKYISPQTCDIIITDIKMPQMDGIEFLKQLNGEYDAIIITAYAAFNTAIEAIRLGVKDFFIKSSLEVDSLVFAINRVLKMRNIKDKHPIKAAKNTSINLDGKNIAHIKNIAQKAAKSDASVLLLGESGVGKEVFARFIHSNSNRANAPFIAINMASLPEHLLESELFGYEKGAFTDATSAKIGLFEAANKGSIFLDEIGEMPLGLQAKLLRAIQEKEITHLGGTKSIKIDVRFISATNANLSERIKKRSFREDLFYRIQTIPIKIPPLRERKDEILPIANAQIEAISNNYNCGKKTLSQDAIEVLLNYKWHGNIRELLNVIECATILSDGEKITRKDLFLEPRLDNNAQSFDELEKQYISEAFNSTNKDIQATAKMLGMNLEVLKYKMQKLNIL